MIQYTQNRDSRAIHLKLDELIRAVDAARNRLVDVEDVPDEELARLTKEFQKLRRDIDSRDRGAPDQDPGTEPDRRVPTAGRTSDRR
jgi:low affinity Fe/Cu permease